MRLDAVDRLLDVGMEILNTHAEAIETQLAESFKMRAGGYARVDLDANLAVEIEVEMFLCKGEEILDLLGCQVGWGAAAPVELDYGAILGDAAADAFHFLFQDVKIRRGDTFVFLDDDVAGAKKTEALAEGDVHVERDGCTGEFGFRVDLFEIGRAEELIPAGSPARTGIRRPRAVVFGQ